MIAEKNEIPIIYSLNHSIFIGDSVLEGIFSCTNPYQKTMLIMHSCLRQRRRAPGFAAFLSFCMLVTSNVVLKFVTGSPKAALQYHLRKGLVTERSPGTVRVVALLDAADGGTMASVSVTLANELCGVSENELGGTFSWVATHCSVRWIPGGLCILRAWCFAARVLRTAVGRGPGAGFVSVAAIPEKERCPGEWPSP